MKLKAKLITAALVLLGTIVLSGCDYQINPRYPYRPDYSGYPYNPNYIYNPATPMDFDAAIRGLKWLGPNNSYFKLIQSGSTCEYNGVIYNYSKGPYINNNGIIQIHLTRTTPTTESIILIFDLRFAWQDTPLVYIHHGALQNNPMPFFGHQ